jgi:Mn-containing catalase
MENNVAVSDNKRLLAALEANWQAEMEGFHTYTALSKSEPDPHRRNALRGLATAEKHHADLWAGRIKSLGGIESKIKRAIRRAMRTLSLIVSAVRISRFDDLRSMKVETSQSMASNSRRLGMNPASQFLKR